MAGTFSEQAQLATDNTFIGMVKRAMISRAVELYYSATAQPYSVLAQAKEILISAGNNADKIAALVIAADATISANAPVMPTDSATQTAVNTVLTALLK